MTTNKAITIGVALALAGGLGWQIHRRLAERADTPEGGRGRGRPVPVEASRASRATLRDEAEFSGTLSSRSRFIMAPKVSGRLERLLVDMGDEVRRGDLIAILDGEEYVQQTAQAQAELEVSQANLQEAQSAREVAANDLKRAIDLHAEQIASEAQLDEARARDRAAEARVQVARAQIRQREAALKTAQIRMAYTRLAADWEGEGETRMIAERFADEGAMLRANDPVVSVTDVDTLLAVVHVIERDFPLIKPGQSATLRVDAHPGRRFEGRVTRRAPELDEVSRHARVEITVDNAERLLAPGMFARVRIGFDEREDACVVPRAALARRNGQTGVFQVDKDTMTVRYVPVSIGIVQGDLAEILEPDLDGWVVTLGHHLLEDGGAVSLPSASAPTEQSEEDDGR